MATTEASAPLTNLTGFQRDCLAAIAAQPGAAGLRIKSWLEAAYDTDELNHGRLYPNLDDLVEMGYVEKGEQDKRTNSYSLTEKGRSELEAHAEWLIAGRDDR